MPNIALGTQKENCKEQVLINKHKVQSMQIKNLEEETKKHIEEDAEKGKRHANAVSLV